MQRVPHRPGDPGGSRVEDDLLLLIQRGRLSFSTGEILKSGEEGRYIISLAEISDAGLKPMYIRKGWWTVIMYDL